MAQRCPSHMMAPLWSSATHIIWAANWAKHLWLGQGIRRVQMPKEKEGDHPAWDWEEQSLTAALSVFSEHRLPSACTPHLSLAGPPLLLMLSRLASLSHAEHTIAL